MRFWLIDLPARLIDAIFQTYFIILAVATVLCFGAVIYSLTALVTGLPRLW